MQGTQLRYVIKFVADMDKAVKFYRDVLGLNLKFESPGWSEFATGEITVALHPGQESSRQGRTGVTCRGCRGLLPGHERQGRSVHHAAEEAGFRRVLAQFVDSEGRTLQRWG